MPRAGCVPISLALVVFLVAASVIAGMFVFAGELAAVLVKNAHLFTSLVVVAGMA